MIRALLRVRVELDFSRLRRVVDQIKIDNRCSLKRLRCVGEEILTKG